MITLDILIYRTVSFRITQSFSSNFDLINQSGASESSHLVTSYPQASIQVPRYADTVPPTAAPVTTAPTPGPTQASSNTGVVAASVVGSFVAFVFIVGGLWYYRKKSLVWKKNKGERSAMIVPINVAPIHLIDSQKDCESHNIADLDGHGEDDVALFAMSQKAEPIPKPASPTRVALPRDQDDGDDDGAFQYYERSIASRGVGAKLAAMLLQSHESDRRPGTTSNQGNQGMPRTDSTTRNSVAAAAAVRALDGNHHHEDDSGSMPVADIDEAYQWILRQFTDTTHPRPQPRHRNDNDGSTTIEADDASFSQLEVDNITMSSRQSPVISARSSSSRGGLTLTTVDEVMPFSDDLLSVQSQMSYKPLPSITGLSIKPTSASLQRENLRTKGKVQPMATDMDENITVHHRSSKRAFAPVAESSPQVGDPSSLLIVSDVDLLGSDDDVQPSFPVKKSTRNIDQDSDNSDGETEKQMLEIRKQIIEKKALLFAAKEGSSSGKRKELQPDTRTSNGVVLSPKTWV